MALTLCSSSSLLQVWHLRCRIQEFAKGRCEQLVGFLKDFLSATPKDRSSLRLVLWIPRRTNTFVFLEITSKRNNLAWIMPLDQCMFEGRNSFSMVCPCLLSCMLLLRRIQEAWAELQRMSILFPLYRCLEEDQQKVNEDGFNWP